MGAADASCGRGALPSRKIALLSKKSALIRNSAGFKTDFRDTYRKFYLSLEKRSVP